MKVIKNGQPMDMSYEEICHDLGFIPAVQFVDVTAHGTITFTCGKREEIAELYGAVMDKGYKPTSKFTRTFCRL